MLLALAVEQIHIYCSLLLHQEVEEDSSSFSKSYSSHLLLQVYDLQTMEQRTPAKERAGVADSLITSRDTKPSTQSNFTANNSRSSGGDVSGRPALRTHLSTPKHNFELLASKTVSQAISEEACVAKLPASPVDSVPSRIHPRFPRFSIASESSYPDSSASEVTSTKVSSDDEIIVATRRSSNTRSTRSSKRQKLQVTLHRAMSAPALELRRISSQIRRVPSVILPKRTSRWLHRTISESQTEQAEDIPVGLSRSPFSNHQVLQKVDMNRQSPFGMLDGRNCRSRHKLSDLPEDHTFGGEAAVSQQQLRGGNPYDIANHATQSAEISTFGYTARPSITAVNSYHTAREQVPRKSPMFLCRASSWSYMPNCGLPRSISSGTTDEQGRSPPTVDQLRNFSMPAIPSRQSSLIGSSCSSPRRYPRALSVCDVEDLTSVTQLQRDPMFVDIRGGHQLNFIFPGSNMHTSSLSPQRRSMDTKRHSYASLQQKESTQFLVRSYSHKGGYEKTPCKAKIPLFVPSQIVTPATGRPPIPERQSSRFPAFAALRLGDAAQDEQTRTEEGHWKEALSEASDWSTTVQFEAPKQEVFQSKSEASLALDLSSTLEVESQAEGPHRRGIVTQLGLVEVDSAERGLSDEPHSYHRSMRLLESCYLYFQRFKHHLWQSSKADV